MDKRTTFDNKCKLFKGEIDLKNVHTKMTINPNSESVIFFVNDMYHKCGPPHSASASKSITLGNLNFGPIIFYLFIFMRLRPMIFFFFFFFISIKAHDYNQSKLLNANKICRFSCLMGLL